MNNRRLLFTLAAIVVLAMPLQSKEYTILSPDKSLSVTLSDDSVLTYSVVLSGTGEEEMLEELLRWAFTVMMWHIRVL